YGPVEKYNASPSQSASVGVTCGRPSERTVVTQNSSAPCNLSPTSRHVGAVTPSVLYRASSLVTGSAVVAMALSSRSTDRYESRRRGVAEVTAPWFVSRTGRPLRRLA